jgi:hypothetical protein
MAVDAQDKRLLDALDASWHSTGELEPSELTASWLASARELLKTALDSYRDLIRREDIEEIEAMDAMGALRASRNMLSQSFKSLLDAIEQELLNRRAAQLPADELTQEAAHFLHDYQLGAFASLRPEAAYEEASYARELLRRLGAQERRANELERAHRAMEAIESARRVAGAEGAEAVEAYAHLVEGRAIARVCYLAARDLVSAALRLDGQHDQLDKIIPPLSIVLDEAIVALPPLADDAPTQQ